jgi:hypothetical protein
LIQGLLGLATLASFDEVGSSTVTGVEGVHDRALSRNWVGGWVDWKLHDYDLICTVPSGDTWEKKNNTYPLHCIHHSTRNVAQSVTKPTTHHPTPNPSQPLNHADRNTPAE